MKNKEIHNNFDKKEIRDFLAKSLKDYYNSESLQKEIDALTIKLEKAKEFESALALIYSQGWDYYDISDDIQDFNEESYYPFVGTRKEFEQIFKK